MSIPFESFMASAGSGVRRQRKPRCRAPRGLSNDQLKTWRRQRASGRELTRIHELREAFDVLRTVIPRQPDDDKYSKVQVLKYAISYIKLLQEICLERDSSSSSWSDCTASPPPSYSSSCISSEPASPYSLDWAVDESFAATKSQNGAWRQTDLWQQLQTACSVPNEVSFFGYFFCDETETKPLNFWRWKRWFD